MTDEHTAHTIRIETVKTCPRNTPIRHLNKQLSDLEKAQQLDPIRKTPTQLLGHITTSRPATNDRQAFEILYKATNT